MEGSVRPRFPPAAFSSRKHGNRLFSLLPPTITCTHDVDQGVRMKDAAEDLLVYRLSHAAIKRRPLEAGL
jgi:hypothetical protein